MEIKALKKIIKLDQEGQGWQLLTILSFIFFLCQFFMLIYWFVQTKINSMPYTMFLVSTPLLLMITIIFWLKYRLATKKIHEIIELELELEKSS